MNRLMFSGGWLLIGNAAYYLIGWWGVALVVGILLVGTAVMREAAGRP